MNTLNLVSMRNSHGMKATRGGEGEGGRGGRDRNYLIENRGLVVYSFLLNQDKICCELHVL